MKTIETRAITSKQRTALRNGAFRWRLPNQESWLDTVDHYDTTSCHVAGSPASIAKAAGRMEASCLKGTAASRRVFAYGRKHSVTFFRSPEDLANHFDASNSGTGVVWDVDLDFFTVEDEVPDQCYTPPMSKQAIRSLLNPKKTLDATHPW